MCIPSRWSVSCRAKEDMRPPLLMPAALMLLGFVMPAQAQDAQALRERHAGLRAQLTHNAFGRALHVESSEDGGVQKGAIYAVLEQPFKRVAEGLRRAPQWCDALIVQANVKNCEASAQRLGLFVARRPTDAPDQAYRVDLSYEVLAAANDYLSVVLGAPQGPFGTMDYRIRLEATPLDQKRAFLHLAYSYTLQSTARMGMGVYLATSGRNKVGFSVVERTADGGTVYVGGVRGIVERNTMRYYLALEAYLGTLGLPAGEQVEQRLRAFHAGLERYPRQLHELELDDYLDIKRRDASRMLQARR